MKSEVNIDYIFCFLGPLFFIRNYECTFVNNIKVHTFKSVVFLVPMFTNMLLNKVLLNKYFSCQNFVFSIVFTNNLFKCKHNYFFLNAYSTFMGVYTKFKRKYLRRLNDCV